MRYRFIELIINSIGSAVIEIW